MAVNHWPGGRGAAEAVPRRSPRQPVSHPSALTRSAPALAWLAAIAMNASPENLAPDPSAEQGLDGLPAFWNSGQSA